jgi:tRNA-dihydrouridine synthase
MQIGPIHLTNPVILAPMTGVTDLPFRRLANGLGAGLVVSESWLPRDPTSCAEPKAANSPPT